MLLGMVQSIMAQPAARRKQAQQMWYTPDQMENRQRAVFMAGCDYLLPELVSMATTTVTAGA